MKVLQIVAIASLFGCAGANVSVPENYERELVVETDPNVVWTGFVARYGSATSARWIVELHPEVAATYKWRITANEAGEVVIDRPTEPDYRWLLLGGRLRHASDGVYDSEIEGSAMFGTAAATLLSSPGLIDETALDLSSPDGLLVQGTSAFRVPINSENDVLIGFNSLAPSQIILRTPTEVVRARVLTEQTNPSLPSRFFSLSAPPPTSAEVAEFEAL